MLENISQILKLRVLPSGGHTIVTPFQKMKKVKGTPSFVKNTLHYRLPLAYNNCPKCIKEKITTHSYQGFVKYTKQYFVRENYNSICNDRNCYICSHQANQTTPT